MIHGIRHSRDDCARCITNQKELSYDDFTVRLRRFACCSCNEDCTPLICPAVCSSRNNRWETVWYYRESCRHPSCPENALLDRMGRGRIRNWRTLTDIAPSREDGLHSETKFFYHFLLTNFGLIFYEEVTRI